MLHQHNLGYVTLSQNIYITLMLLTCGTFSAYQPFILFSALLGRPNILPK